MTLRVEDLNSAYRPLYKTGPKRAKLARISKGPPLFAPVLWRHVPARNLADKSRRWQQSVVRVVTLLRKIYS